MKYLPFLSLLIFFCYAFSPAQVQPTQTFTYSLCASESGSCSKKCTVKLTQGKSVALGSYVKVYAGKELITEGYILKHISGSIFILKDKKQANDPDVCGGCCGGAYEIFISKKQIWGC